VNMGRYIEEVARFNELIDRGIAALREASRESAEAEHAYRIAKAQAWAKAPAGTVPVREAWVEAEIADERLALDLSEGAKQVALEAVRSRRQQLSAVQSLLAAHKEEAAFARTGA
jgi:hypothetical protein